MKIRLALEDRLFSRLVKLRDGGICQCCGKIGSQTSHFHSRRKRSTRYDLDNAIWVCFGCHRYLDENPYQHTEFFKKRLGSQAFEELNIRAERIVKTDREQVRKDLREKIKILETESK